MKKFFVLAMVVGLLVGCAGGESKIDLGNLNENGIIDRETDIPMLAYAFLKIKPEAAIPLSKFCMAVRVFQDKDKIMAVIENQLDQNKSELLQDDFTRQWLLSKAEKLAGIIIDEEKLEIVNVDENVDVARLKEILNLICEGVWAYLDSVTADHVD